MACWYDVDDDDDVTSAGSQLNYLEGHLLVEGGLRNRFLN